MKMEKVIAYFWIDDFDSSSFIDQMSFRPEKGNKLVKLRKTRPFLLKEVYMLFMLYLNEDFDDDLLLDAMDILDCDWTQYDL